MNTHKINGNIYITSEEEIKEGDWTFDGDNLYKWTKDDVEDCLYNTGSKNYKGCKKIILTTDEDLINDGIGDYSARGKKFYEGGEIDIEDLPTEVQEVLEKYQYEEEDYHTMLRMSRELKDLGYTFDFGLDAIPTNFRKMKKGGQVGEIKDAIDILESLGDDIDDNVKQALDMLKNVYDEMELPEQPKSIEDIIGENAYKKGGRMKFRDKVDAIADRLEGTKVPKRLRKDYGVTYNREEAEMSGRRIVGSMVKKYGK